MPVGLGPGQRRQPIDQVVELVHHPLVGGPGLADRVGQGRRISDLTGSSSADDVADPYGGPRTAYERLATELDDLLGRLVAVAFAGAMAPR